MKSFPITLITACILAPSTAFAQPSETPPPAPKPHETEAKKKKLDHPYLEAWKKGDKDQDGMISQTEFDALPRIQKLPEEKRENLFKRLDKNTDGKLDRKELGRMNKPPHGPGPRMPHLWELDVDKSGGVSLQEFKAGDLLGKLPQDKQEELFHRLDTNHDGVISPIDKPEPPPFERGGGNRRPPHGPPDDGKPKGPREGLKPMIRHLDQDGNGTLSFDEFRLGPMHHALNQDEQKSRFDALDRNHDQVLSPEDLPPPPPAGAPKRPGPPEPPRPE